MKRTAPERDGLILIIILSAFIVTMSVLIFILPRPRASEKENRVLAEPPALSLRSVIDGSFTRGIADFYADRIPFRDGLITLRSYAELFALRRETGGVIVASEGYLVDRLEYGDGGYANIRANLDAIDRFASVSGIETHVAVLPNAVNVLGRVLPSAYSIERADAVYRYLPKESQQLCRALKDSSDRGEYVWYRTDHHYTTLGAYYAYLELGGILGYEPYPLDFFDITDVSDSFLGTSYSSAGLPPMIPDTVTLFRYAGDENFTVTYGDTVMKGFYDMSRLDAKDKYAVFLGGNHALTSVRLDGAHRETLVIVKDSFSHALAPFLALHFDLELVDLRYYSSSVLRLCREVGCQRILVLCGVDTLATATDMKRLEIGLYSKHLTLLPPSYSSNRRKTAARALL